MLRNVKQLSHWNNTQFNTQTLELTWNQFFFLALTEPTQMSMMGDACRLFHYSRYTHSVWVSADKKDLRRNISPSRCGTGEGREGLYLEFWKPFFNNTSLWTQHLHQRPPTRLPGGQERERKAHKVWRGEMIREGKVSGDCLVKNAYTFPRKNPE